MGLLFVRLVITVYCNQPPKEEDATKICNTHVIIDNAGAIKGTYSKTHLFNVDIKGGVRLSETKFTIPGEHIGPPVETPVGKVGMAIVSLLPVLDVDYNGM